MKHLLISILLFGSYAQAEETKRWQHESELGMIIVDGNAESETTNAKQQTIYTYKKYSLTAKAAYTESESDNELTAQSWSASLRYDRKINDKLSGFISYGAESDRFAGYLQRDLTDVGVKYQIKDTEKTKWHSDIGWRHIETNFARSEETDSIDALRLYSEVTQLFQEGVTGKFWVEYVSQTDSDEDESYIVNYEPSITAQLSGIFSLKSAYLVKYQNIVTPDRKKTDTTFTTSLVAKF